MGTLDGLRIVVTRPAGQAASFAAMIRERGGEPVLFPTIDIAPLGDCSDLDAALNQLADFDLAIFVSANAVTHTLTRLANRTLAWPAALRAAATGPATSAELRARGVDEVIHPATRFDSEGLLAEIDRQGFKPRRVLIFRGEGGREWLLDHLTARGVSVRTVAAYRRVMGTADAGTLSAQATQHELDAITVTSSEGGENLMAMLGPNAAALIGQTPVFVPHPRIAARMRALDCAQVVETAGGDAGLLAGLQQHFTRAVS